MALAVRAEQSAKLEEMLRESQMQLRHLDEDYRALEVSSKRQALNLEASNANILELTKQKDRLQDHLKKAEEHTEK